MAAGTVTVSELTTVTMAVKKQYVHLYTRLFNSSEDPLTNNFSFGELRNMFGYIIRPNEVHVMVDRMPLAGRAKMSACRIRLTAQNLQMTVGQGTPLSVLLNLGCFHVEQIQWRGQVGETWSGP